MKTFNVEALVLVLFIVFVLLYIAGFSKELNRIFTRLHTAVTRAISRELDFVPPYLYAFWCFIAVVFMIAFIFPTKKNNANDFSWTITFISFTMLITMQVSSQIIYPYSKITRNPFSSVSIMLIPVILVMTLFIPKWGLVTQYIIIVAMFMTYVLNTKSLFSMITLTKGDKLSHQTVWKNIIIVPSIYLIIFTFIYYVMSMLSAGAFQSKEPMTLFNCFYYSVITFCTIGFGDISPATYLTKFVTIVEALTSILCLSVFLNSVISLQVSKKSADTTEDERTRTALGEYVSARSVLKKVRTLASANRSLPGTKAVLRIMRSFRYTPIKKVKRLKKLPDAIFHSQEYFDAIKHELDKYTER